MKLNVQAETECANLTLIVHKKYIIIELYKFTRKGSMFCECESS